PPSRASTLLARRPTESSCRRASGATRGLSPSLTLRGALVHFRGRPRGRQGKPCDSQERLRSIRIRPFSSPVELEAFRVSGGLFVARPSPAPVLENSTACVCDEKASSSDRPVRRSSRTTSSYPVMNRPAFPVGRGTDAFELDAPPRRNV